MKGPQGHLGPKTGPQQPASLKLDLGFQVIRYSKWTSCQCRNFLLTDRELNIRFLLCLDPGGRARPGILTNASQKWWFASGPTICDQHGPRGNRPDQKSQEFKQIHEPWETTIMAGHRLFGSGRSGGGGGRVVWGPGRSGGSSGERVRRTLWASKDPLLSRGLILKPPLSLAVPDCADTPASIDSPSVQRLDS